MGTYYLCYGYAAIWFFTLQVYVTGGRHVLRVFQVIQHLLNATRPVIFNRVQQILCYTITL